MAKKKSKKKHKKKNSKAVATSQKAVKKSNKPKKVQKPAKKTASQSVKPTARAINSDNKKYLVFILLAILGALLIAVLVLANQTNEAKNDAINTGQDELLKVQPGNPESLQPNGSDNINPQQSSPSPQGDGGAANDIQPQTPVTPEQQEQIQQ